MELNSKLREHTTSVAFTLTLKRTMIEAMQHIKNLQRLHEQGIYWSSAGYEGGKAPQLYVTGFWALERRGLVVQCDTTNPETGKWDPSRLSAMLTPAGEHVWQLLLMAGLALDIEESMKLRA